MTDRDALMEAIEHSAYYHHAKYPKCGNYFHRSCAEAVFCQACGQKLHLRAFTQSEVDQARFDREMDAYEDL